MNTLNICAMIFAAISFCADNAYNCEAKARDIYDFNRGDSGLDCYGEDEMPSYKVAKVGPKALKVTATYKGKTFVKLYNTLTKAELWQAISDGTQEYELHPRLESGLATILAAYADTKDGETLVALERIYKEVPVGTEYASYSTPVVDGYYTYFSYNGQELDNRSYKVSTARWETDRLISQSSLNMSSDDAYRILTAAALCRLPYEWVMAEVRRSLNISRGHANYLYQLAAGRAEAV